MSHLIVKRGLKLRREAMGFALCKAMKAFTTFVYAIFSCSLLSMPLSAAGTSEGGAIQPSRIPGSMEQLIKIVGQPSSHPPIEKVWKPSGVDPTQLNWAPSGVDPAELDWAPSGVDPAELNWAKPDQIKILFQERLRPKGRGFLTPQWQREKGRQFTSSPGQWEKGRQFTSSPGQWEKGRQFTTPEESIVAGPNNEKAGDSSVAFNQVDGYSPAGPLPRTEFQGAMNHNESGGAEGGRSSGNAPMYLDWTDEELAEEIKAWESAVAETELEIASLITELEIASLTDEKFVLIGEINSARDKARTAKTVLFKRYRVFFNRNNQSEKADAAYVLHIASFDEIYGVLEVNLNETFAWMKRMELNYSALDTEYERRAEALNKAEAELKAAKESVGDVGAADPAAAKSLVDEKERARLELEADIDRMNLLYDTADGFYGPIDSINLATRETLFHLTSELLPLYREFYSQVTGEAAPATETEEKDF